MWIGELHPEGQAQQEGAGRSGVQASEQIGQIAMSGKKKQTIEF